MGLNISISENILDFSSSMFESSFQKCLLKNPDIKTTIPDKVSGTK